MTMSWWQHHKHCPGYYYYYYYYYCTQHWEFDFSFLSLLGGIA